MALRGFPPWSNKEASTSTQQHQVSMFPSWARQAASSKGDTVAGLLPPKGDIAAEPGNTSWKPHIFCRYLEAKENQIFSMAAEP